jgi:hypothetical protein
LVIQVVAMGTEEDSPEVPVSRTATPPKRSKSPTWVGKVVDAKDEQIAAIKELSNEKTAFMIDRLDAEYKEREKRSKTLYEISQARANDMQRSLEGKDTTIKRLWIANVIQVLIIAALAGVTVTGKIPFIGDIGLDAPSKAVTKDE